MQIDKKHLDETLRHLGLTELPSLEIKNQIWVYALQRVRKINGRIEYVVVRHDIDDDGNETNTVIKDLGTISAIKVMYEIRPFEYVTETPSVQLNTISDFVAYLSKINKIDEDYYKGMGQIKVKALLKKTLIEKHKKNNKFSNGK